jgi:hypothetical protein
MQYYKSSAQYNPLLLVAALALGLLVALFRAESTVADIVVRNGRRSGGEEEGPFPTAITAPVAAEPTAAADAQLEQGLEQRPTQTSSPLPFLEEQQNQRDEQEEQAQEEGQGEEEEENDEEESAATANASTDAAAATLAAVALACNATTSKPVFALHPLNHTGDRIIEAAAPSASCTRLCDLPGNSDGGGGDSAADWPAAKGGNGNLSPMVYNASSIGGKLPPRYAARLINIRSSRFIDILQQPDYLRSLRQPGAWDSSTWASDDDPRWAECNYICEIPDAFVDANGHACSLRDRACFSQEQCKPNVEVMTPCDVVVAGDLSSSSASSSSAASSSSSSSSTIKRYPKVLVISQFAGAAIFHGILENVIKLGDALEILQAQPDVYLHIPSTKVNIRNKQRQQPERVAAELFPPLLAALGFDDPSRLVFGPVFADKLIYPRGTACGRPSTRQLLKYRELIWRSNCYSEESSLALEDQQQLNEKQQQQQQNKPPDSHKKRILLVSRKPGAARSIKNHEELRARLAALAESKGYVLDEFKPPPPPPASPVGHASSEVGGAAKDEDEQAKMDRHCGIIGDMMQFERSSVIVAPHGAGLSNLLLCKPNTTVVEIHASDPNPVFVYLSVKLGLRHFVLVDESATSKTPMTANVSAIAEFLEREL